MPPSERARRWSALAAGAAVAAVAGVVALAGLLAGQSFFLGVEGEPHPRQDELLLAAAMLTLLVPLVVATVSRHRPLLLWAGVGALALPGGGAAGWALTELVDNLLLVPTLGVGAAVALALRWDRPAEPAARVAAVLVLGLALTVPEGLIVGPLIAAFGGVALADELVGLARRGRPRLAAAIALLAVAPVAVLGALVALERVAERQGALATPPLAGEGRVAWRAELPRPAVAPPTLAGGRLLVLDGTRVLRALDPASGEELWTAEASLPYDPAARPLPVAGGAVVVGGGGSVAAFDLRTGERRWRVGGDGDVLHPAAAGDVVVSGEVATGLFYGLDAVSGEERWRLVLDEGAERPRGAEAVAASGTTAYLFSQHDVSPAGRGTDLVAVDATTGRERWRRNYRFATLAAITPGAVWIETELGLVRLDAAAGEERRREGRWPSGATAVVVGDTLFAGGAAHVDARPVAGGPPRWFVDAGAGRPSVDSGVAYVPARDTDPGSAGGSVLALDAATGDVRWLVDLPGGSHFSPALDGTHVYAVSGADPRCGEPDCPGWVVAIRR